MIDPLLKIILDIKEILTSREIGHPAHGIFYEGLYVKPGITVREIIKQYKLRDELCGIVEILQEFKHKISITTKDSRIHYSNIGLSAIEEIDKTIKNVLSNIAISQKENMTWLVEMHQKINNS